VIALLLVCLGSLILVVELGRHHVLREAALLCGLLAVAALSARCWRAISASTRRTSRSRAPRKASTWEAPDAAADAPTLEPSRPASSRPGARSARRPPLAAPALVRAEAR
jgi:hypothetical protein